MSSENQAEMDVQFLDANNSTVSNTQVGQTISDADQSVLGVQEDPLLEFSGEISLTSISSQRIPSTVEVGATASCLPPRIDISTSLKLSQFQINWKTIPHDIIQQLEGRQPNIGYKGISVTNYNRLVDHITAQIRAISTRIPFQIFRKLALQTSNKYTNLRDCDDDGLIIGDGSYSLADKLRNHNSYLNRAHRTERHTTTSKHQTNRQCTVGVREHYYKSGRNYCSKEHLKLLTTENANDLSDEVLLGTEAYMRFKIDNSMNLPKLLEDLPVIRQNVVLYNHFNQATGCSADAFTTNFTNKKEKLIEVSKLYNRSLHISSSASDFEVVEGVAKLLGENLVSLLYEVKVIALFFII